MSRVFPIQTNFTAGILDELLEGRVDLAKYNNGARAINNFIIFQQGGIKGRPGTRFVAEAKFPDKQFVLIPFSFNVEQNYVLEVGNQYIRIFTNNAPLVDSGGVPVEIVTPYVGAEVFELGFVQSADVLYLTHPNHRVRTFNRTSANTFSLLIFSPTIPPLTEFDTDPNLTAAFEDPEAAEPVGE